MVQILTLDDHLPQSNKITPPHCLQIWFPAFPQIQVIHGDYSTRKIRCPLSALLYAISIHTSSTHEHFSFQIFATTQWWTYLHSILCRWYFPCFINDLHIIVNALQLYNMPKILLVNLMAQFVMVRINHHSKLNWKPLGLSTRLEHLDEQKVNWCYIR